MWCLQSSGDMKYFSLSPACRNICVRGEAAQKWWNSQGLEESLPLPHILPLWFIQLVTHFCVHCWSWAELSASNINSINCSWHVCLTFWFGCRNFIFAVCINAASTGWVIIGTCSGNSCSQIDRICTTYTRTLSSPPSTHMQIVITLTHFQQPFVNNLQGRMLSCFPCFCCSFSMLNLSALPFILLLRQLLQVINFLSNIFLSTWPTKQHNSCISEHFCIAHASR